MTNLRTAAQQALETLEALQGGCTDSDDGTVEAITVWCPEVIDALRAALAEPVQEPVAWRTFDGEGGYDYRTYEDNENYAAEWAKRNPRHLGWVEPLYTAPPQRKPLTEEEIDGLMQSIGLRCADDGNERMANHAEWERRQRRRIARAVERAHGVAA